MDESMLAYGNVLFSIYCKDVYYRKGLVEILDKLYISKAPKNKLKKLSYMKDNANYFLADIVVLSSKSIFEKMPIREQSPNNDVVIVLCSENMSHIIRGMKGYDNTLFINDDIAIDEVSEIFSQIIFGSECSRKNLFEKKKYVCLTSKEKKVSELLKKGLNQQQIATVIGINAKTVSSHLRSTMAKYSVSNILEYRVKLQHMSLLDYG